MVELQKYWFAARTKKGQELAIRDSLKERDIECFIPTQFVIRQLKYRKVRVEVPVIRNLVFVYTTKEKACSLANDDKIPLYYMKDLYTHSMLVVPEKQMRDFMLIMDLSPESVSLDSDRLTVGVKVRVIKGELCGVEGELLALPTRTYVVIRILGLLTASIKVPKNYLEIIG